MTFYTGIMIITELFMLAMLIHVMQYSGLTKLQKIWFIMTFAAIMLCAAAEYVVHCGLYDPKAALFLTILTILQFSTAPVLGILLSGALGVPHQKKIAIAFFLLNLIVECLAAPFGWVFCFNQDGYFRGAAFFVYEVFFSVGMIYLFINIVRVGKSFRHRDRETVIMILLILIAGILPMALFQLNISYMAAAICAGLSYIYYNDLVQQDIKAELISNQEKLSLMQEHIISGLANLIESRDTETGEHVSRTSRYVKMLAGFAKEDGIYTDRLDDEFIVLMYRLAPMHDVGKIVVPDHILKKPGKLTDEEFEQMKRHASEGGRVIREVLSGVAEEKYLSFAADIATFHHERWDGRGYPQGLSGEEIPLSARIMAIADVFDALISERCYKKAMPTEKAFAIIQEEAGTHFDPNLAMVFIKHKNAFI